MRAPPRAIVGTSTDSGSETLPGRQRPTSNRGTRRETEFIIPSSSRVLPVRSTRSRAPFPCSLVAIVVSGCGDDGPSVATAPASVSARATSIASASTTAPVVVATEHAPVITLEAPGVLAGTIVDVDGKPRDLRLVLMPRVESARARVDGARVVSELSVDRGRFRFEDVPRGRWTLALLEERWAAYPIDVELADRGLGGVEVVARPAPTIVVEVGERAVVLVRDASGHAWHEREHDGTAVLALLAGEYVLDVTTRAGRTGRFEFPVSGERVTIDLRDR